MELRNGKRLVDFIKANGWKVLPLQLVVLRNADSDSWQPLDGGGKIDHWDDAVILLSGDGEIIFSVRGTADPGLHYSKQPMNPAGTARIANGQHLECWQRGWHFKQRAFTQCKPIMITRDRNRNLSWSDEQVHPASGIGLNIHTTANSPSSTLFDRVGRWSAGCVVIRSANVFYNTLNPKFDSSGLRFLTADVVDSTVYAEWRRKWS